MVGRLVDCLDSHFNKL